MANPRQLSCPRCRIVCTLDPNFDPGVPLRCALCSGQMLPGDLPPASQTLPQPSSGGSIDEPRAAQAGGMGPPALTRPLDFLFGLTESHPAPACSAAGRYVEQRILGRGGMGEVALCFDRSVRRLIALKRMLPATRENPLGRLRFVEEAQITGQLEHPNIVPVHDLEQAPDGTACYTMKFVKGRTLGELLSAARQGSESPSLVELLNVFLKICDAIGFAHSRGVIHRDVKPSNIMLGDFGEVLVTDWGLARILSPEVSCTSDTACATPPAGQRDGPSEGPGAIGMQPVASDRRKDVLSPTLDGTRVGTPTYMSPEQVEARIDQIGERSDIYALGAILYEMLTLQPAIEGATQAETLVNVIRGSIQRPEQRAPARQIPRELADAAMKSLATRKEDRYSSVAELRQEISLFLEGREAWIPVCSIDFADSRLDARLDAGYSLDGFPQGTQWVSDPSHVTIVDGLLSIEGPAAAIASHTGFVALHWREPIGEDMRVSVTVANRARNRLRITVSGDTVHGYRFCLDPFEKTTELETAARGYWEILQTGRDVVDWTRGNWEVVIERSGQWVKAWVDGVQVIEYFDLLPLAGADHHTFGISSRYTGWSIAGLKAWRRRTPESVSVLETGRFLLQNKLHAEAARFLVEQLATPRSTVLDDEARMLYGLALEGLGRNNEAVAAFEAAARSANRWMAAVAGTHVTGVLKVR